MGFEKLKYEGARPWYQALIVAQFNYLHKLLDDNNIPWWLDFGSLLGAVRNQGMIPWDYDIDIGMFHDDVEKLLNLTEQVESAGYTFLTDRNQKHARIIRFHVPEYFDFHIDITPWTIKGENAVLCMNPEFVTPAHEIKRRTQVWFEGRLRWSPINVTNRIQRHIGINWREPKVLTGNLTYIEKYCPTNEEIKEECGKYESY